MIEMAHPGDMFDGSMIDPEILGSERWCQTEGFTAPGITSLEVRNAHQKRSGEPPAGSSAVLHPRQIGSATHVQS